MNHRDNTRAVLVLVQRARAVDRACGQFPRERARSLALALRSHQPDCSSCVCNQTAVAALLAEAEVVRAVVDLEVVLSISLWCSTQSYGAALGAAVVEECLLAFIAASILHKSFFAVGLQHQACSCA